jgi:hypothetical protein
MPVIIIKEKIKNNNMKYSKLLAILLLSSVITFCACGDNKADARKQEARESLGVVNPPASPNATPNPATPEPAQNAEGVWHYTCGNGCAGGAGAAGNCSTCGGALAHNTAYHANKNSATINNATSNTTITPTLTPPATLTPPPTEPAQNAKGVWHYTCAKGCAGGGAAAGTCGTCGGALAHNAVYHQ